MNALGKQFCSACLNSERTISTLIDVESKKYFLQNILEKPSKNYEETQIYLCWECDALIRRFMSFKNRIQKMHIQLLQYNCDQLKLCSAESGLRVIKIFSINILPDTEEFITNKYDVIKTENVYSAEDFEVSIIKEELSEGNERDYSDDDDKFLIEITSKKKKQSTNVKKKSKLNNVKKKTKKKEKEDKDDTASTKTELYREIELSSEEITLERSQMELKEDYVNALFKCERCILSFPNSDDLQDHISIKHELNASKLTCSVCYCTFASEVAYNYHRNKHARRYECATCGGRAASRRAAQRHCETAHTVRVRTDLMYGEEQKPNENNHSQKLETNDSSNTEAASFPCALCDKSFRWKTSLRKHAETHRIEAGQKRRPYCEPCRLSFTTTANLQKHVKTSSKHQIQLKLRKLKDSHPEEMKEENHLEQIKSSVNTNRQTFACEQCDRRFQWKGNLLRHLQSHAARATGELVCKPCDRTFSSIATYNQHMRGSRKHVSESEFKHMCSDCGARFANKTRLADHVNWEHLKHYVHKCPVCQKVFKSHTSLYLHRQVVHRKDSAEHLCDHCGKPFPNRAKLRIHITALHTSEAPYACSYCGARFSWHSCLSRHVRRVHAGKKAEQT